MLINFNIAITQSYAEVPQRAAKSGDNLSLRTLALLCEP